MARSAWITAAKIGRAWSTVFRLAATGTYTTTARSTCTCSAMRAGSASARKRTAAVSTSPPANAFASAPIASRSAVVRRKTRLPSVSDVYAATVTRMGAPAAPGRVISSSSPACASRIVPSDSGMRAPAAGSWSAVPSGASKCCMVVSAGNASSEVAYRWLPWRTNTLADGTPPRRRPPRWQ